MQGRSSSIVEIGRFQLQQFTVSMKELAEWFGLEIPRIAVDGVPTSNELSEWQNTCNAHVRAVMDMLRSFCESRGATRGCRP